VRVDASAALSASPELELLGPDPLGDGFDEPAFSERLSRTRRDLKSALLDQRLVAGLGNIYVSEVLFVARVSPLKKAHRTTKRERSAIYAAICTVLARAVQNRGTSFSDYVDAEGRSGDNQHALFVYGRAAQPCKVCEGPIRRVVQGARSSFYCPRCQRTR
jgi:formamidopyrimidine-DNA glycosylase